jgi:Domain of Unknown Function (DUF928)
MIRFKSPLLLTMAIICCASNFTLAQAEANSSRVIQQASTRISQANRKPNRNSKPTLPLPNKWATNSPPPEKRGDTGKKGEACPNVTVPLTALTQLYNDASRGEASVWSWTNSETPTFWFYVPYEITSNRPGKFELRDETGNYIYEQSLTSGISPGIVGLKLPKRLSLKANEKYLWTFTVLCNPAQSSKNEFVQGWVQRIVPSKSLVADLKKARTPAQKAGVYRNEYIYYEALTILGELRRTKPNDAAINKEWNDLLSELGLNEVSTKPVTNIIPLN